jgi:hypothetical protein
MIISFKLFTEVSEGQIKWLTWYVFQTFVEAVSVFIFVCCFAMLTQSMWKSGEITRMQEQACSELLAGLTFYVILLELISVWCAAVGCAITVF